MYNTFFWNQMLYKLFVTVYQINQKSRISFQKKDSVSVLCIWKIVIWYHWVPLISQYNIIDLYFMHDFHKYIVKQKIIWFIIRRVYSFWLLIMILLILWANYIVRNNYYFGFIEQLKYTQEIYSSIIQPILHLEA